MNYSLILNMFMQSFVVVNEYIFSSNNVSRRDGNIAGEKTINVAFPMLLSFVF